jgi:hypothetical protein
MDNQNQQPVNPFDSGKAQQPVSPPANAPIQPVASTAPITPVAPITPKKSNLGLILGLSIGGGVLIIGAILLALFLVLGKKDDAKTTNDSTTNSQVDNKSDEDSTKSNSSNNSNKSSSSSNSAEKAEYSINAVINDDVSSCTYTATKLTMNAFDAQSLVDSYAIDKGQKAVIVSVTAACTKGQYSSLAWPDDVEFQDQDGNKIRNYNFSTDVRDLAGSAGYPMEGFYDSTRYDKDLVTGNLVFFVDSAVTKDDIYMVYDRPDTSIIGGSGGTIAGETYKVRLTE